MNKKKTLLLFVGYFLLVTTLQAEAIPACSGPSAMLAIVDRPSVAYSACPVPTKSLFIETGYSYQQLTPTGFGYTLPQTEWRLGVLQNTELDLFPANYNWQSKPQQSGFGFTSVGVKKAVYYDAHQLVTLQGYVTPPSGGQNFGTRSTGFLVNGIYNYNFDSGLGLAALLGFSSLADSPAEGGQQYYSVNPIVVVSYPLLDKLSSYIEFSAQSKTASNQEWGVNFDSGLIMLAGSRLTVDIVYGQRITGLLNNVNRYVGSGFVLHFG